MDTSFPGCLWPVLEVFRLHGPAQPCADWRGDIWALARLGTTRKGLTNLAHPWGFVAPHLASWARWRVESPWDLRDVRQTLVRHRVQPLGARLDLWGARWAAVDPTRMPKAQGRMPGVQKWPDHRGHPAHGASRVGHHWARSGMGSGRGATERGWPVLARRLPGQRHPLGGARVPTACNAWTFGRGSSHGCGRGGHRSGTAPCVGPQTPTAARRPS